MKRSRPAPWSIVLAAGDGTRLRALTTDAAGHAVPKQYCSLFGGRSLLEDALARGRRVARADRVCVVVAGRHARWWNDILPGSPPARIIVQPANRGTANGMLLALLTALVQDPRADIVFLPADLYVGDEERLDTAIGSAVAALERDDVDLAMVGIAPNEADPDRDYIDLYDRRDGLLRVARLIERPSRAHAASLVARGALWNSAIVAANGARLLARFRARIPEIVAAMAPAVTASADSRIATLYSLLPSLDFARELLGDPHERLAVIRASGDDWIDVDTEGRVRDAVERVGPVPPFAPRARLCDARAGTLAASLPCDSTPTR